MSQTTKHMKGHLARPLLATLWGVSTGLNLLFGNPTPVAAQTNAYCQLSQEAIAQKNTLRNQALQGNSEAQRQYRDILNKHADLIRQCRNRTWPQEQAIWLRLYPCDVRPGAIESLMDRVVNRGYNKVYVEVFFDGQVLLPKAENNTPWPSAIRTPGSERVDLLAQAINKGKERGLSVYAWMFTMNFGYNYAQRSDRQQALARDGYGNTSLKVVPDGSQVFIDPYHRQARIDYYNMVQQVLRRRPDGILFDYVRYPRQGGTASVASRVQDLWVYGEASKQALLDRALNNKGRELIRRYVERGTVTAQDIAAVNSQFPQEGPPLWQGRNTVQAANKQGGQPSLQWELWQLAVAHAAQGVLDFVAMAALPAQQMGIKNGAVFFPEGNQAIGQGYDSRVQPWDRFPSTMEWHPMSYALCGGSGCIADQVARVLSFAPSGTKVYPALAGVWGQTLEGGKRPSLEEQMRGVRVGAPQVAGVSHFAFSWQEPEIERDRKFCKAP